MDPNTTLTNSLIMNPLDAYIIRDWLDWLNSTCVLDVCTFDQPHQTTKQSLNKIKLIYIK